MRVSETFTYTCPECQCVIDAVTVAAGLSDEIICAEAARRNGRRQTPHAGPGRPVLARCPGCDQEMSSAGLRDHRRDCVRDRLNRLTGFKIRLEPKDPDPYPEFTIAKVADSIVEFQKLSNQQYLPVEIQKLAEITPSSQERLARIRLHGRVEWDQSKKEWHFVPSVLGRPIRRGRKQAAIP